MDVQDLQEGAQVSREAKPITAVPRIDGQLLHPNRPQMRSRSTKRTEGASVRTERSDATNAAGLTSNKKLYERGSWHRYDIGAIGPTASGRALRPALARRVRTGAGGAAGLPLVPFRIGP